MQNLRPLENVLEFRIFQAKTVMQISAEVCSLKSERNLELRPCAWRIPETEISASFQRMLMIFRRIVALPVCSCLTSSPYTYLPSSSSMASLLCLNSNHFQYSHRMFTRLFIDECLLGSGGRESLPKTLRFVGNCNN